MPQKEPDQEVLETGNEVVATETDDVEGPADAQPEAGASLPAPVEAMLKRVPVEERGRFRSMVSTMLQVSGPAPHPMFDKLTSEHLTKIIDGSEKDSERIAVDRRESRSQTKFMAVAGMVTFLAASGIFLFAQQADLLTELVRFGVVLAGGIGIGVGYVRGKRD